ncbi:MAG: hypothetical protein ACRCTE_13990 [Cellulosilyticaceae bacterium]
MKKLGWILCSAMLLVGCSEQEVAVSTTVDLQYAEEVTTVLEDKVVLEEDPRMRGVTEYTRDQELLQKSANLCKALGELDRGRYYDNNPSGYRIEIEWETVEALGMPLSESIYGEMLEEIYPGIRTFIESVEREQVNKAPQSIVLENAQITMIPMQLYPHYENYGVMRNRSYLTIENTPFVLTDEYFKTLEEPIDSRRFIVSEPYVSGDTKMVRFYTPAFNYRAYVGESKDDDWKEGQMYYEADSLAYQLYTKGNGLQKIRVIHKKLPSEQIQGEYFEPLYSWCQSEWAMTDMDVEQVEELVSTMIAGDTKTRSGQIGQYSYTYKGYNNPDFRYTGGIDGGQSEDVFELILEKK